MDDDEAICVFPHRLDDSVQSMVFVVNLNSSSEEGKTLVDCCTEMHFSVYGQGT